MSLYYFSSKITQIFNLNGDVLIDFRLSCLRVSITLVGLSTLWPPPGYATSIVSSIPIETNAYLFQKKGMSSSHTYSYNVYIERREKQKKHITIMEREREERPSRAVTATKYYSYIAYITLFYLFSFFVYVTLSREDLFYLFILII